MRRSRDHTSDTRGKIIIAATPIGNLSDVSLRLKEALEQADILAVEGTRTLAKLTAGLNIKPAGAVVRYSDHDEAQRAPKLVERARAGATVLLLSDAGTPTIADPGHRLVTQAIAEAVPVTVIPGPCAAVSALAVSGLASDRFVFDGFVARKAGQRQQQLGQALESVRTTIMYESPHRLAGTLETLEQLGAGDRRVVIVRELTKLFEEVLYGTAAQLAQWAASSKVQGEIVLLIGGRRAEASMGSEHVDAVLQLHARGIRLKAAAAQVATEHALGARALYEAVLASRPDEPADP